MILLIYLVTNLLTLKYLSFLRDRVSAPLQGLQTLVILFRTPSGGPFEQKSFNLESSFNLVQPFQLKSRFSCIEQDLHRQNYRKTRKKNLTKEEYKTIRSLQQK